MAHIRYLSDVIQLMINIIPPDQTELIDTLKVDAENSIKKHPSDKSAWIDAELTLTTFIPLPKKYWEYAVWSIFTKKSIYDLKLLFK